MLKRVFRKARYAILLLKLTGPGVFFRELRHQVCSRTTFIGQERNLDTDSAPVPCRVEYSLRLASEEDMEELSQKAKSESRGSARELLLRKRFYDAGFHNCYVARTVDTGDLCFMQWLITPEDLNVVSRGFRSRFPRLKNGDVLFENGYCFEKYRGKGMLSSVHAQMFEVARRKGFKRVIGYIAQDNIASLKSGEKAGFRNFEEIGELKLLFFTKRKYPQGSS
jgi:hypothetical protein